MKTCKLLAALLLIATSAAQAQQTPADAPKPPLGFFVTSSGLGKGADLGGLSGADAHCQKLASAVGAGNRTWRAYLSTQAANGQPAVNARDRIGKGPWANAKGAIVANNVAHLHGDTVELGQLGSNVHRLTTLTEKGTPIKGVGETPNEHDILTGSRPDGTAYTDAADHTCKNYTSSAADGSAQVGHFDRTGGGNTSWNSAHGSRGCSQENLVGTGGAGLLYCFASN
ncbi:MAG: lectin [Zoogloea oleivorans]|jgi:hypothetical protein|uniref:lectin n=1 Tax=Zoogloea oleivorans TaxID=1552750 RepID=UPI002A35D2BB|nr:lectin [Zoogloea oleivorans]MDY0038449.1 lectin [Zoogloea oleivorans]